MKIIEHREHRIIVSCFLAVLMFFAVMAFHPGDTDAAQGLTPSGPIGGTDLNQALIPPPGLYAGLIYGYIDYVDWHFDNDKGHKIDDGVQLGAVGFSYVYDAKIFGGSILSSASWGYQDFTFGFTEQDTYSHAYGAMDMYTDIFFWSRFLPGKAFMSQPKGSFIPYGLSVGGGLGVTWPTGTYHENDAYNVGSNFYTLSPSIALTWTTPSLLGKTLGDATQLSARIFYNYYTENKDADFQNGAILSGDFAISQMKGPFQYGFAFTTFTQVTDDDLTGPKSAGRSENKAKSFNIGPIVQYNFMIGDRPWAAKLKTGKNLYARNGADTALAVFVLGTSF